MLQTTNPIDNHKIYSKATSSALLAWHRVRLANWLADNGKDWAEYIKEYNSGGMIVIIYKPLGDNCLMRFMIILHAVFLMIFMEKILVTIVKTYFLCKSMEKNTKHNNSYTTVS